MWVITENKRSPDTIHHVLCNRDVLVGRTTSIKFDDDKSISRVHACIHVVYTQQDMASPTARGRVTISDHSKYGTSIGGQRMETDQTVQDGAVITFGIQWNTWTLKWRPLSVVTSLLSTSERDALTPLLVELGATLLPEWRAEVDLLVMSSFKISVKAVQALASGVPIVTPALVRVTCECRRMCTTSPTVAVDDFRPAMDEPSLGEQEPSIAVDSRRRTLLFGKQFVFAEAAHLQTLGSAIELAGGTPVLLSDCGMSLSQLTASDVIVMHTDTKSPEINRVKAALRRRKLRMVRDQEVGLAILRVSCDRDCNPAFDYTATFLTPLANTQSQTVTGAVLARETQPPETVCCTPSTCRVVPPTPATPATPATPVETAAAGQPARRSPRRPARDLSRPGASTTTHRRHPPRAASPDHPAPTDAPSIPDPPPPPPPTEAPPIPDPPPPAVIPPTAETSTSASAAKAARRSSAEDWETVPDSKRVRREDGSDSGPETECVLADSSHGRRRYPEPRADDPPAVFKRPRLSETMRPRRPVDADDDLFGFETASTANQREPGGRAPTLKCKREPSWDMSPPAVSVAPGPAETTPRPVKPAPPGDWLVCTPRPARQPRSPSSPGQPAPPVLKQVSPADGDDPGLPVASLIRLEVTSLVCRHPAPAAVAPAAVSAAADFKRFRRVRQPPLCPHIIGGSDLFNGSKQRHVPLVGDELFADDDAPPPADEARQRGHGDIMAMLNGVGARGRPG